MDRFRMNMDYFAFGYRDRMTSSKMNELFDGPPRTSETDITQREMDIAASIQAVTEEIVLRMARHAHQITGMSKLTMAGGVALNCVANGRVLREGPFDEVWIQPAAGDAGGALGAALFAWYQLLDKPRDNQGKDVQHGSLLGPHYSDDETRTYLDSQGAVYQYHETEEGLCQAVAGLLAEQNVVGHMGGRMEFGPRALGSRSILGDARSPEMQTTMNLKIKFRESFRPFAPAILREDVDEFFEMRPNEDSPYMLLVAPVKEDKRLPIDESATGLGQTASEALGGSGDHARGPFGARPNRRPRSASPLRRHSGSLQSEGRAAQCSSTPASTCAESPLSTPRRTPIGASWAPIWTCS